MTFLPTLLLPQLQLAVPAQIQAARHRIDLGELDCVVTIKAHFLGFITPILSVTTSSRELKTMQKLDRNTPRARNIGSALMKLILVVFAIFGCTTTSMPS